MAENEVWNYVDEGKQEQPDHINEVPIPSRKLEPEVLLGCQITRVHTQQTDRQEDRSDYDVRTMEAGRHGES